MMEPTSEMKEVKSLKYKVTLIEKTRTMLLPTRMEVLTNNGTSSTLTNIQKSQRRENSTKNSDSMLKDHSTSSLN